MKNRFVSLATRNAIVYFFLFVIGLVLSGIFFFSYSSTEILDLTQKRLKHTEEMVQLRFETYIDQVEKDLEQLSFSPLLDSYLTESDSVYLDLLTKEYRSFLYAKSDYFQIRLITANPTGKEIIRVESKEDSIITCPTAELQFKGNRDYFKEINALPFDSLYISKIDLNKEHDQIAEPRVPTLRIGKKIKGARFEDIMLVVNVNLNGIFMALKELLPAEYELRVLNQDGDYLIHPDESAVFTFEYDQDPFYHQEYELPIQDISKEGKSISDKHSVDHFFQLKYPRIGYSVYGVVTANKDDIFATFYSWRNKVLMVSVGIAILFLLIAFIYMRRQAKDLTSITKRLTLFSSKMEPNKIGVNRKDEIGELAKSFEKMSAEIYQSHSEVAKAKDDAEKAYKEKNEFLENMSHEIRNPLQSILGMAAILEQNEKGRHQKPFIDSLKFSAIQLNSLVTDVLDYGKIKKGQIALNPEWNDLEGFCEDLINASMYEGNKKGVSIQFQYADKLKAYLFKFDSVRIYQILNNLLNNAVKFTPKGGNVVLSVFFENNKVGFKVADTGAGIVPENLSMILNRSVGSDYTSGSGLGLTIVQELIHLHHAELQVESKLNVGSAFSFNLELDHELKDQASINDKGQRVADKTGLNILVLEDDPELINWYQYIFAQFSLTVYTSIKSVNEELSTFDLIISDMNFGETAFSVEKIKEFVTPYLKSVGLLLVVSGNEITSDEDTIITLQKPIKKATLDVIINRFINQRTHGKLNFANLENDYDYNKPLIKNALTVLISEWERDSNTLKVAILNRDQVKFDAVKHRIITSVRRLEINEFEDFLNTINLSKSQGNLDEIANSIQEKFTFYIQEMKAYL
jgi:signal transduction histidine kinase